MAALALVALLTLGPFVAGLLVGLLLALNRTRRRLAVAERDARSDPLTGLGNRRALAEAWAAADGDRALLMVDLVGFKAVNDAHGHAVGDALLAAVAARLAAAVAPPGMIARWGGDEFAVLVPPDRAEAQAGLLHQAMAAAHDLTAAGGPPAVRVGLRIGQAVGCPTLDDAVARAVLPLGGG